MSDDEPPTDWLANSVHGYGYGYTKEQALAALSRHVKRSTDSPIEVDLVEHRGWAKTNPGGFEVDELVSYERVEIPAGGFTDLRDAAIDVMVRSEELLDDAVSVDTTDE
jgi:hypothetical protein